MLSGLVPSMSGHPSVMHRGSNQEQPPSLVPLPALLCMALLTGLLRCWRGLAQSLQCLSLTWPLHRQGSGKQGKGVRNCGELPVSHRTVLGNVLPVR